MAKIAVACPHCSRLVKVWCLVHTPSQASPAPSPDLSDTSPASEEEHDTSAGETKSEDHVVAAPAPALELREEKVATRDAYMRIAAVDSASCDGGGDGAHVKHGDNDCEVVEVMSEAPEQTVAPQLPDSPELPDKDSESSDSWPTPVMADCCEIENLEEAPKSDVQEMGVEESVSWPSSAQAWAKQPGPTLPLTAKFAKAGGRQQPWPSRSRPSQLWCGGAVVRFVLRRGARKGGGRSRRQRRRRRSPKLSATAALVILSPSPFHRLPCRP